MTHFGVAKKKARPGQLVSNDLDVAVHLFEKMICIGQGFAYICTRNKASWRN